jgi:hypothetical protein
LGDREQDEGEREERRRKKQWRKRFKRAGEVKGEASLSWEHVLECAQSAAEMSFSQDGSLSVDVSAMR